MTYFSPAAELNDLLNKMFANPERVACKCLFFILVEDFGLMALDTVIF